MSVLSEDQIVFHKARDGKPFDGSLTYYLAGPTTGLPDYNYPAFESAMTRLSRNGVKVKSPHEPYRHETAEERTERRPYTEYTRSGISILLDCQAVILLQGWVHSSGVELELRIARALGMPVWYYGEAFVIHMGDVGR